jgi:hypothetical protein
VRQYQFNGQDGQRVNWAMDCEGVDSCDAAVEVDFYISKVGNVLVYGDTEGRIFALACS